MDEKTYRAVSQISSEEWRKIILRLGGYAVRVSRSLRWRTRNPLELPGGETVESIVSKAIEKLFSGVRNWNPDRPQSLEHYLMDVIDSLLNHLADSFDNKKGEGISEDDNGDQSQNLRSFQQEGVSTWARSPLEDLLEQEQKQREQRVLDVLMTQSEDDPALKTVLDAMRDGYENARSIAKKTGLSVDEVYVVNRRLKRMIKSLHERLSPYAPSLRRKGTQNV
jgi:hypothetical protein